MSRTLVYGGSFNPPHLGHIRSVITAAQTVKPDRILLIPDNLPPHKALAEGSPTAEQRLELTRLAAESVPGCEVSDMELRRGGRSYTADTLAELKAEDPEGELFFLLGTDMLLTLDSWYAPEKIMSLAAIVLFAREQERGAEISAAAERLRRDFGGNIILIPGEPVTVSSTEIRGLLPERKGRELLPEAVYACIIQNRLYGARPEFDWLRREAYAFLKPKRIPHVQGTEAEAVRLADRWGENGEDAAEAAICHDITKKYSLEEQLRLCAEYGIMADTYEKFSEKLLHAKTGAELAGERFGLPEHIRSAIRWHTTGRAGMSRLEKIIYLADYIEPGRAGFDGLEELRRAAYEDLDLALELGLRMSLAEVSGRGQVPHINTIEAHAWALSLVREKGLAPVRAAGIPDTADGAPGS